MIFSVPGHVEMIRNGIYSIHIDEEGKPMFPIKSQSRRLNRGIYQIGKNYAVQCKRGVKAEPDIRIVIDLIWPETTMISKADANSEGGYTQEEFERVFRDLNPKWDGRSRWAFKFHVVGIVRKGEEGEEKRC